jgi:hypothetical protein
MPSDVILEEEVVAAVEEAEEVADHLPAQEEQLKPRNNPLLHPST